MMYIQVIQFDQGHFQNEKLDDLPAEIVAKLERIYPEPPVKIPIGRVILTPDPEGFLRFHDANYDSSD